MANGILEYLQQAVPDFPLEFDKREGVRYPPLRLPEGGIPVSSLRLLLQDGFDLPAELNPFPESLQAFDAAAVTALYYASATDDSPVAFGLGLTWDEIRWAIVPDLFEITQVGGFIGVMPGGVSAAVRGAGVLGKTTFNVSLELPSFEFLASAQGVPVGDVFEYFHLPGGMSEMEVEAIILRGDPQDLDFRLDVTMRDVWRTSSGTFAVEAVEFSGRYQKKLGLSGDMTGKAILGSGNETITLHVGAEYSGKGEGWTFEGRVASSQTIESMVNSIGSSFGLDSPGDQLPEILGGLIVDELGTTFNTATKDFTFTLQTTLTSLSATSPPSAAIDFRVTHPAEGLIEQRLSGTMILGAAASSDDANSSPGKPGHRFDLIFDRQKGHQGSTSTLAGVYSNPGGEAISLGDLVGAISSEAGEALGDAGTALKFPLKNAVVAYQTDGAFLFAVDMDLGLELSGLGDLPLIGKALPKDFELTVGFQPVIGSTKKKPNLKAIRNLLPENGLKLPDKLDGGFNLVTTLKIGGETRLLGLPVGKKEALANPGLGSPQASTSAAQPPDPGKSLSEAGVKWIDIQKNLGPLHFQRAGFAFSNGKIAIVLDADMTIGPMAVALAGLGAEYELATKKLAFRLDGLGLGFKRPPLEISGAFLRLGEREFGGKAIIRAETFGITALGAYGEFTDTATGQSYPSLFLYAFIDYPIGGPTFFFVEGLALGFGLNRRLTVPPVGEIHKFPLVSAVIGDTPPPKLTAGSNQFASIRREFETLSKYITPEPGQYFLAVGLKFSSFKLIDSFALLTLSFGRTFEVAVMGVSRVKLPPESPNVLAVIEMAFSARFRPAEGFLAVQAQLTPNSWVLSPNCQIQASSAESVGQFWCWEVSEVVE